MRPTAAYEQCVGALRHYAPTQLVPTNGVCGNFALGASRRRVPIRIEGLMLLPFRQLDAAGGETLTCYS